MLSKLKGWSSFEMGASFIALNKYSSVVKSLVMLIIRACWPLSTNGKKKLYVRYSSSESKMQRERNMSNWKSTSIWIKMGANEGF
jgi:hypothetical protein